MINQNPHIAAWFFNHRVKEYLKEILFKQLLVIDSWYRIEFQHRGSPHLHGFVWLANAPNVENLSRMNEEEKASLIKYFENLVSASNNDFATSNISSINPCQIPYSAVNHHSAYSSINANTYLETLVARYKADYNYLINKVQRHTNCTISCLRKKRNRDEWLCRYGFPKELVSDSFIHQNENGNWELKLKRNDARMNNHSPFMSVHWSQIRIKTLAFFKCHDPIKDSFKRNANRKPHKYRSSSKFVNSSMCDERL